MSRLKSGLLTLFPALVLALFAGACDTAETTGVDPDEPVPGDEPAAEAATLRILLTDAAADYIAEANVDIGRVELLPSEDGSPITLSEDGTDGYVNLLELQNAATMQLAEAEVEAGLYHQLRLIVESANVTLKDDYTFRDGSRTKDLKVPSGAQTGIKLLLRDENGDPLELASGETVVVLDFDVNRSFVIQGNPETPAGIRSMLFKPTIKVTGMDVAASISGMLSVEEGLPEELLAGQTVIAEPTDAGDLTEFGYQSEAGTAVTAEDGSYTIFFLVPGEYEVRVLDLDASLGTEPGSRTVTVGESEDATGVDFRIVDVTGSISGAVALAETISEDVPVTGLDVTVTPIVEEGEDPAEPVAVVQTDETGAYTVDGLLPGSYSVSVAFEAEGYLLAPAEAEVEVGRGEDVEGVDFTVLEVSSVRGAVSTELEDFIVEGLTVTASTDADGVDDVEVTTDAEGDYVFLDLAAATWTLTVDVGEGFVTVPGSIVVELDGTSAFTGQDFTVEEAAPPAS